MITLTTAGQTITNADGSLATGEVRISPAYPFEYDGANGRIMVTKSISVLSILDGKLVDTAGQPSTYNIHPTSGAGNDVANNYYDAVWIMNGATPIAQKWNVQATPTTLGLLDIQIIGTPALPVITVPGATGQSVDHVSLTAGTSLPGTTDTYTMWGDVGETINLGTYTVHNGADGQNPSGALLAANNLSDVQSAQTSLTNIGGLGNTSLINGGGF